jgi:hypothetical protein
MSTTVQAQINLVPIVAGVAGTVQRCYGYSLASNPVVAPGAWSIWFVAQHASLIAAENVQPSYFLVRHYDVDWNGGGNWYLESVAAPRQASYGRNQGTPSPLLSSVSDSVFKASLCIGTGTLPAKGVDLFTWTAGGMYSFVPVGDSTVILGSQPMIYDGEHCTQLAFPLWPDKIKASVAAVGGLLESGTYYYRIVLAYRHADGRVERSAPSAAIEVVHPPGTATNLTTLRVQHRMLDRHWSTDVADVGSAKKASQAYYEVYRTTVADSVNFHLVPTSPQPVLQNTWYTDISDGVADAGITTKPYIYTTEAAGEPVANTCPPTARFGCLHRGRVWLGGTEDPFALWFSKYLRPGEGIAFTDEFTLDLRDQGQPVTGLASLEDKLVVFTESQTFVVYGDGPADAGGESGFDPPLRVSAQIGCTNHHSIVQCPAGVFFLARGGIYQIDRGLSVTFAGSPAFKVTRDYPACLAAMHVEAEHEVRWLLSTGTESVLLCFDYLHGQWTTQNPVKVSGADYNLRHAAAVAGVCHVLAPTSSSGIAIAAQNASVTSYRDILEAAGYYTLEIETADIHLGAIQGYQRVWRAVLMLEGASAYRSLVCQVAYDYEDAWSETKTWTAQQLWDLGSCQVQVNTARQQAQAVRLKFFDLQDPVLDHGGGEFVEFTPFKGFNAVAIGFEYGTANGLKRLPTAARR